MNNETNTGNVARHEAKLTEVDIINRSTRKGYLEKQDELDRVDLDPRRSSTFSDIRVKAAKDLEKAKDHARGTNELFNGELMELAQRENSQRERVAARAKLIKESGVKEEYEARAPYHSEYYGDGWREYFDHEGKPVTGPLGQLLRRLDPDDGQEAQEE